MDYPTDNAKSQRLYNGKFTRRISELGVPASFDPPEHLNALTDELLAIIVAGGLTPDKAVLNQVLTALNNMYRINTTYSIFTGNAIIRLPGAGFVMQLGTGPGHHSGTYFTGRVTFEESFDQVFKVFPSLHTNGAHDHRASVNYFDLDRGGFSYNLSKFQASGAYTIMYLATGIINS
jgi:hypothetical protein